MEFNGGKALSWSRVERILSGRESAAPVPVNHLHGPADSAQRGHSAVPFAELHAVSSYSFLDGAAEPEELVGRAVELGLEGLAIVDRDGFYGLMKFAEAAAKANLPAVYGAELSLAEAPVTVLARTPEGYRRLSRLIAHARMEAGEKDRVDYPPLDEVARELEGECFFLVGPEALAEIDNLLERIKIDSIVLEYSCSMSPLSLIHI